MRGHSFYYGTLSGVPVIVAAGRQCRLISVTRVTNVGSLNLRVTVGNAALAIEYGFDFLNVSEVGDPRKMNTFHNDGLALYTANADTFMVVYEEL